MSKHTPGPWSIGKVNKEKQEIWINAMNGDPDIGCTQWECLAKCYGETDWPIEGLQKAMANAQLIAAAPELLAVLEELQESAAYWSEYDVPIGIVDRINAAIAKAKGEV